MNPIICTRIPQPDAGLVAEAAKYAIADLHESLGAVQGRMALMSPRMRPLLDGRRISGAAVTSHNFPGDNLMIHVAVEVCTPGSILVVAPTSYCTDGYFGELLGTSLRAHGVKGLIIEAGCRDVAPLTEMKFPIWSRAISSQGTVKATLGSVNVPIVCAGASIEPGDVIVADDDGVVVVRRADAAEVAAASKQRIDKEDLVRARLAKGELGLDIYNLRPKLKELGLEYR